MVWYLDMWTVEEAKMRAFARAVGAFGERARRGARLLQPTMPVWERKNLRGFGDRH